MALQVSEFISNIANPAKSFLWNVIVPRLPLVQFTAQTAQFPSVGSTDIDLFYQGQMIKFAGAIEYEHTWVMNFVESETAIIYNALYEWRQLLWDQVTGLAAVPAAYKDRVTVQALTSQGIPWLTARLKGVYPKIVDAVEMDRSANTEAWKWNVTFSFDEWEKIF